MVLIPVVLAVLGLAYLGIVLRTAWRLTHPDRGFLPEGYAATGLPLERIRLLSRDGYAIAGWVARRPDAPGTVVFSHGVWTNHREMESRAAALWERGFNALVFDYRACGESDGSVTTLSLREVDDLLGAIDFLAGELDRAPIGVWGNSMGGAVALLAAAKCPHIDAVISDSAFAVLTDNVGHGFRAVTDLPAWPFRHAILAIGQFIARADLAAARPIDHITALAPRPLLLVHGEADHLVRIEDAHALHAAAGEPKELWQLPECGHVEAFELFPAEFTDRAERFFREAFAATGRPPRDLPAGETAAG
ncbi:MAG: alpha/beta fold hydrolase [Chloroflexota bacterium]|jgi:alpha-beta hydrolase superfamily lysophospholipase|nr:alpha/beta fold hydrolase [Chloroflexota bacterium]MDP6758143.1 alpha/beta fold hydrolase [Chloroflexota bacterium]